MRSRKQCRYSLRVNGQSLPCEILSSHCAAAEKRSVAKGDGMREGQRGRKNERYNDNNAHAMEEDKPSRAPEGAVHRFCIPRPRPLPPLRRNRVNLRERAVRALWGASP